MCNLMAISVCSVQRVLLTRIVVFGLVGRLLEVFVFGFFFVVLPIIIK